MKALAGALSGHLGVAPTPNRTKSFLSAGLVVALCLGD